MRASGLFFFSKRQMSPSDRLMVEYENLSLARSMNVMGENCFKSKTGGGGIIEGCVTTTF